jgi:hypothetical protein
MLVSQHRGSSPSRQGSRKVGLAELRRGLSQLPQVGDVHRQRLLDLRQRLARVQALGGEYARIGFSEFVSAETECRSAVRVG